MRDYPSKFSKSLMKRKNTPLYEEGGEVEEFQGLYQDEQEPTAHYPDTPTPESEAASEHFGKQAEETQFEGRPDMGEMPRKQPLPRHRPSEEGHMDPGTDTRGTPMSNLPKNVTGDMPVAPDTRELQAADYHMRVINEMEKRQRERDVPGPFKKRPFPAEEPKKWNI